MNLYEATIRVGSGLVKVTITSDNTSHARALLESQYGVGKIMNLHQVN